MKQWFKNNKNFLLLVVGFLFFRSAIADWNPVPSASMHPSILEGDVVLVNRMAYDAKIPLTHISLFATGEPARGDIVTFDSPVDGTRLIKRLVAIPGDTVEMKDDVLLINGQVAQYQAISNTTEKLENGIETPAQIYRETLNQRTSEMQILPNIPSMRSFSQVIIPAGQYMMLGDNRNNSADSRFIGLVPRELLIAKAERILISADITANWAPRFERFGQKLN